MRVAIVGAGIGGLVAALALARRGCDVDVYEQTRVLKEVGAGLQLSANGTRVLCDLGILDRVVAAAFQPVGKEVRLWNTGRTWKLFDLGAASVERYGFPYLTVYRPDLLEVLARAVRAEKPGAIHLDSRASGVARQGDTVRLELESGERVEADVLVGADGVHSRIREALFGKDQPRFTGIMSWRGTVPMARLPAHMARTVGTNWIGPGGHVVHYPLRR